MKRSDMVKHLEASIINHMNCENCGDDETMYSHILHDLEIAGMKPPCRTDFGGHGTVNENNECDDYVESCHFWWEEE